MQALINKIMKQLIIIGAGGMGRVMYDMARESVGHQTEYDIKGTAPSTHS